MAPIMLPIAVLTLFLVTSIVAAVTSRQAEVQGERDAEYLRNHLRWIEEIKG